MTTPSSSVRPRGLWLRRMRQYHRLLGLFFTPAILFFAVTGALQTLELHDAKQGKVPLWLAEAASLHKHQRLWKAKPLAQPAAPIGIPLDKTAGGETVAASPREHPALRFFVVLMAIALAASAMMGCVIALQLRATRRGAMIALAAGVAVPMLLFII